jgi:hypothetical protein
MCIRQLLALRFPPLFRHYIERCAGDCIFAFFAIDIEPSIIIREKRREADADASQIIFSKYAITPVLLVEPLL